MFFLLRLHCRVVCSCTLTRSASSSSYTFSTLSTKETWMHISGNSYHVGLCKLSYLPGMSLFTKWKSASGLFFLQRLGFPPRFALVTCDRSLALVFWFNVISRALFMKMRKNEKHVLDNFDRKLWYFRDAKSKAKFHLFEQMASKQQRQLMRPAVPAFLDDHPNSCVEMANINLNHSIRLSWFSHRLQATKKRIESSPHEIPCGSSIVLLMHQYSCVAETSKDDISLLKSKSCSFDSKFFFFTSENPWVKNNDALGSSYIFNFTKAKILGGRKSKVWAQCSSHTFIFWSQNWCQRQKMNLFWHQKPKEAQPVPGMQAKMAFLVILRVTNDPLMPLWNPFPDENQFRMLGRCFFRLKSRVHLQCRMYVNASPCSVSRLRRYSCPSNRHCSEW